MSTSNRRSPCPGWAHPTTCASDYVAAEALKTHGKQPASIIYERGVRLRPIHTHASIRFTLIVSGITGFLQEPPLCTTCVA